MTSLQKQTMTPLPDQEFFEALLLRRMDDRLTKVPEKVVIWFSASWCGPCKRVDSNALMGSFPDVTFYKCDVDDNNYTPGFCGVRSIPAFLALHKGAIAGPLFQNSNTEAIVHWITSVFQTQK
jgi:thioredoxin-like negative regulator of GroEL